MNVTPQPLSTRTRSSDSRGCCPNDRRPLFEHQPNNHRIMLNAIVLPANEESCASRCAPSCHWSTCSHKPSFGFSLSWVGGMRRSLQTVSWLHPCSAPMHFSPCSTHSSKTILDSMANDELACVCTRVCVRIFVAKTPPWNETSC